MWWQGIDAALLKPTCFPEGDPICPVPGKPPGERWETQQLLVKAREARPASGAAARRAVERRQPRPSRPSSAPALLRGTRLPAGASHEPPPPGRPPRDPDLDAFRRGLEASAVQAQLGYLRQSYRPTQDAINAVNPLEDSTLFDLKVLHNKAQRKRTVAVMEVARRAKEEHERSRRGSLQKRERRDRNGGDKDQRSTAARQMREWCDMLDASTKKTCKSMAVNHRMVEHVALSNSSFRAARKLFKDVPHEDSSEDDRPPQERRNTTVNMLRNVFRTTTLEAAKRAEAFNAVTSGSTGCLQQVANFLQERGDLHMQLSEMDALGTGRLTAQDWDYGLTQLGWSGDAMLSWGQLAKGQKTVSVVAAMKMLDIQEEPPGPTAHAVPRIVVRDRSTAVVIAE